MMQGEGTAATQGRGQRGGLGRRGVGGLGWGCVQVGWMDGLEGTCAVVVDYEMY